MSAFLVAIIVVFMTLAIYLCMNRLYRHIHLPFLMPALTTPLVIIIILICFRIPYKTYMIGGEWINHLLGPAVVSLAYPLYKQRNALIENLFPILGSVLVGSVAGITSGLILAQSLGFAKELIITLVPKSITTPVAMQIASELGGIPSLATVFVMIAGFSGVIFGPYLFKWLRIDSTLGQGIGLGCASHAIGTAKAFEYGEHAVSMSSVAMTLSAIMGSIIGPLVVWLFYS